MTCCTTLNRIRAHDPCKVGWEKLLRHLGKTKADGEPLPFAVIVESNGIDDATWCFRSVEYDRVWRLYAVWCARQVQHLMSDQRSIAALDVAQRYASGMATRDELDRAEAAAWDAAWDAAGYAAWAAAWAGAYAAARAAAGAAAWDAAGVGAREAQKAMLLRVVNAPTEADAVQILLDAMPATERQAA